MKKTVTLEQVMQREAKYSKWAVRFFALLLAALLMAYGYDHLAEGTAVFPWRGILICLAVMFYARYPYAISGLFRRLDKLNEAEMRRKLRGKQAEGGKRS